MAPVPHATSRTLNLFLCAQQIPLCLPPRSAWAFSAVAGLPADPYFLHVGASVVPPLAVFGNRTTLEFFLRSFVCTAYQSQQAHVASTDDIHLFTLHLHFKKAHYCTPQ